MSQAAQHFRSSESDAGYIAARGGWPAGFQARSKDQEVLEEGDGAGPSTLPRRDHE